MTLLRHIGVQLRMITLYVDLKGNYFIWNRRNWSVWVKIHSIRYVLNQFVCLLLGKNVTGQSHRPYRRRNSSQVIQVMQVFGHELYSACGVLELYISSDLI